MILIANNHHVESVYTTLDRDQEVEITLRTFSVLEASEIRFPRPCEVRIQFQLAAIS